jgi:excisionase family DNA binding protein
MALAKIIDGLDDETRLQAGRLHRELAAAISESVTLRVEGSMIGLLRDATALMENATGFAMASLVDELTPEQAGKILGISRPLVVRRMDDGRLPFRYEGSHRRCRLTDVLALKEAEDRHEKNLRALAETDDVDFQPAPRI